MTYQNSLMTELMVPRTSEVAARITDFYEEIGWNALADSQEQFLTYVHPIMPSEPRMTIPPTVAYWQTRDPEKKQAFVMHEAEMPSRYAWGLRLPNMLQLVEVCLVVPSDETVHDIFERGGSVLSAHSHIPPREHAGRQEFRFADPFNYSLRVTTDPGWEIRPQTRMRAEVGDDIRLPLTTRIHLHDTPGEAQPLDVITLGNLRNAAERFFGNTHVGTRLRRIFDPKNIDWFRDFMHFDEYKRPVGIIQEQLGPFIAHMKQEGLFQEIRGLGQGTEDLLDGLYAHLSPREPSDGEEGENA
jgi:hypothetical protein